MKVHKAVGHPQQREFVRFLRAARVPGEIVQWASKEFKCDICEAKQHPKFQGRLRYLVRTNQIGY